MASSSRFSEAAEEKIIQIINVPIPENKKRIMQVSGHRKGGVLKFIVKGKRYNNRNSALKFWWPQLHPRRRGLQNPLKK